MSESLNDELEIAEPAELIKVRRMTVTERCNTQY
jgi:hypothetical protein